MDGWALLSDDHALLKLQVTHLVALTRALVEGDFECAELYAETSREVALLRHQLLDHFEFEETSAFPSPERALPSEVSTLSHSWPSMSSLRAFEQLQVELTHAGPGRQDTT